MDDIKKFLTEKNKDKLYDPTECKCYKTKCSYHNIPCGLALLNIIGFVEHYKKMAEIIKDNLDDNPNLNSDYDLIMQKIGELEMIIIEFHT